ncbi:3-phosphoshikimate 1-carboxyvinyltransferase [Allosphingosinicella indica]|uniref:3-phosphoshikimate 1-carboxyvinyltransferase n=1 Tax=Allosphingosinicella indica TaxID=941907 RepID=A0A1X7G0T0_9SPHN|nr:3-phosphoshikimate 1-carboxyvinyltransferase [Allosphingosinicella indica]SMF61597.1 3-phosphoshikimate 1-carboxyvinyltransferase [Allosphingosinicella indica]
MKGKLRATPSRGLSGRIAVPGDKSMSHRALILGAMAEGETRIEGLLESDDVLATARAVEALGADVERLGEGRWRVTGGPWRSPDAPIDCGNSGTAARLLMGAAAGRGVTATFTGDASLRARPMDRVVAPLAAMGATIEGGDRLPITVRGGQLRGIAFDNVFGSAQVKSAILLAGLGTDGAVSVREDRPSRDHSEIMLGAFGCAVEREGKIIALPAHRQLRATQVTVPCDPSSAAFPLVAALLTAGSDLTVTGTLANPLRTGLYKTVREMGADIRFEEEREVGGEAVADVTVRTSALRGVTVPANRAPAMIDEYPVLAVVAAFAEGPTVMHGLGELRVKESDRLAAIADGLAACGVRAEVEDDALTVHGCGGPARAADIFTQGDHRIAMSFLVAGIAGQHAVTVDRADMIATSFPGFADLMRGIGARIATA